MTDADQVPDDGLPVHDPALSEAVAEGDASKLRDVIRANRFFLINIQHEGEGEEEMGALTADVDDKPVLVVFSSEGHAEQFVNEVSDMFEESDEVQGFVVDGEALLDYLPEDYGLLFDAESEDAQYVDATFSKQLTAS